MARTQKMSIMVNDEIKHTLVSYADDMGLTLSALCAFVLGDFVRREKQVLEPLVSSLAGSMQGYVEDTIKAQVQSGSGA